MNERAKIELIANPGHVELTVNGENLTSQVSSVIFEAASENMPRLGVVFKEPSFAFEGEGIVQVTEYVDVDPAEAVLAFLNSVNPQALDDAVLNHPDITMDVSPGTGFLTVLKELARAGT